MAALRSRSMWMKETLREAGDGGGGVWDEEQLTTTKKWINGLSQGDQ